MKTTKSLGAAIAEDPEGDDAMDIVDDEIVSAGETGDGTSIRELTVVIVTSKTEKLL